MNELQVPHRTIERGCLSLYAQRYSGWSRIGARGSTLCEFHSSRSTTRPFAISSARVRRRPALVRQLFVCSRPCGGEAVPYCCVSSGTVSALDV